MLNKSVWIGFFLLVILSAGTATALITDDLEAYFKFDNDLTDSSITFPLDLVDQGTILFSADAILGNSASFDGDDKLLHNRFGTQLGESASSTIQWWVKTTTQGGTIMARDNDGSGWGNGESRYYFRAVGGVSRMSVVRNSGGWAQTGSSVNLTDGTWRHIVFVKNGTTETIYINGSSVALEQSLFSNSDSISHETYFGWTSTNDGSIAYSGLMDEVAIWSRALSASEVSQLYNSGSGLAMSPEPLKLSEGLEVYWGFNGDLEDSYTNLIHLTDQGTIAYDTNRILGMNSASFSGDDKLFSNAYITEMGDAGASTIQWWIKTPSSNLSILGKDQTGSGWEIGESTYYLKSGSGMAAVRNSGGYVWCDGSVNVSDNAWHHIVFVKIGSIEQIYVDGNLIPLSVNSFANNAPSDAYVYLGWGAGSGSPYSGLMDEVAIWSRALQQADVTQLYNGGEGYSFMRIKATMMVIR